MSLEALGKGIHERLGNLELLPLFMAPFPAFSACFPFLVIKTPFFVLERVFFLR